ncbi:MAG: hypothetical protein JSV03_12390 [Planctomycetota bacterium]|nr:MAG: hypothetical protein JSV03_12390 [Planctomycetota bacterium]
MYQIAEYYLSPNSSPFQRVAVKYLLWAVCLAVMPASSARASALKPTIKLDSQANILTIKTSEGTLSVSTRCPQFIFEQTTIGGAAANESFNGNIHSGRPIEISFDVLSLGNKAGLDVRLMLKWSPADKVLRKWARFRLNGVAAAGILQEIVLEQLQADKSEELQTIKPSQWGEINIPHSEKFSSYPIFLNGFFMGIEFPVSTTRSGKGQIILAYRPGLPMETGKWYETRKAVYGIAKKGREKQAFQQYITAHRPPPKGVHINYNSWWTSPVPYSEADILKLMNTLDEKLYQAHGVSFDSFCIDMGWAEEKSVWAIKKKLFPEGFTKIKQAAAKMNCNLGLWISPTSVYTGRPGAMNNNWAEQQGYETFQSSYAPPRLKGIKIRCPCLAGKRYREALQDRLVGMVKDNGVRQIKFDGYMFTCSSSGHGHAPGSLSADAVADGIISVFQAVHRASSEVWIETTCFGWNPSPWWLFHVNSVIGAFGTDSPYGRVPAPIYRESYTTARDFFNFQGAAQTACPIWAQEVLGIIHQSPEPLMNDAVMVVMRGHMFMSAYINPGYMSETRWQKFAKLVKWFRRNAHVLSHTQPLLPKSWFEGNIPKLTNQAPMPREPYGYAHGNKKVSLVAIRNPWIKPQFFDLKLDEILSSWQAGENIRAVSLYPEARLYGSNLRADETLKVRLAPYETLVLSIGADQIQEGIRPVEEIIKNRIQITNMKRSIDHVKIEENDADNTIEQNQANTKSAIHINLKADIAIDAPQAELLVLLEGPKPLVDPPLCRLIIDGQDASITTSNSKTGWSASHIIKLEHWLFQRTPLKNNKQSIQLELIVDNTVSKISSWIWAKAPSQTDDVEYPNALPKPETMSLDAVALLNPINPKDQLSKNP